MLLSLLLGVVGVAAAVPATSRPDLFVAATTQGPEAICQPNLTGCTPDVCKAPDCHCSGNETLVDDRSARPQIVYLTYDDAFSALTESDFYRTLFDGTYTNPDGCAIRATHYLTAQYTDYSLVNKYWKMGHEMASHSITHRSNQDYWKGMNKTGWKREIVGMRQMTSQFANIPVDQITGFRAPFLQIGGNEMFEALYENHFQYDCSMPSRAFGYLNLENGLYPYTLDHDTIQDCEVEVCPSCSFPGLWVQPMLDLEDRWFDANPNLPDTGMPCSMLDSCIIMDEPPSKQNVYDMLLKSFNRVYNGNRAPFGLYMHAGWFYAPNTWHYDGYKDFVKFLSDKDDVWIVPVKEGIEYVSKHSEKNNSDLINEGKNSVFGCDKFNSPPYSSSNCEPLAPCRYPNVTNEDIVNQERYMTICGRKTSGDRQNCPSEYPWLSNPCGYNVPCLEWTAP